MSGRHWGRWFARSGRHLERLLPISQRDWPRAWVAEFEEIESISAAFRWLLGGGGVVVGGWIEAISGETIMKTVLGTLSIINVLMGAGLLGLFTLGEGVPAVVALLGVGLFIQAGYTLTYMTRSLRILEPWSLRAPLVGQTAALVVGLLGFATSALYNIDPPGGDHEYGPLTVGMLIALQAGVALWIFGVDRHSKSPVPQA